jgi:ectoine hydroxylase-related dioxygenase (phytanoyl-CoA dioxygenase family)
MISLPHQDGHYVRTGTELWTAWIPLGDCPVELGPLAALPGSHHGGLREHSGNGIFQGGVTVPEDAVWHTTDFECGDVLLLTKHTLHCSLPNVSDGRLRISGDFRYGFWSE